MVDMKKFFFYYIVSSILSDISFILKIVFATRDAIPFLCRLSSWRWRLLQWRPGTCPYPVPSPTRKWTVRPRSLYPCSSCWKVIVIKIKGDKIDGNTLFVFDQVFLKLAKNVVLCKIKSNKAQQKHFYKVCTIWNCTHK